MFVEGGVELVVGEDCVLDQVGVVEVVVDFFLCGGYFVVGFFQCLGVFLDFVFQFGGVLVDLVGYVGEGF